MKKWLRRTLIAALVVGLTLAALYEAATHVGRGWLRGEAFYEGRPTSWWRGRIDEWMERFDSAEDAERSIGFVGIIAVSKDKIDFFRDDKPIKRAVVIENPPPPRTRSRHWILDYSDKIGLTDSTDWLPRVLWGNSDARAVLDELAEEEKYRPLVERAYENIEHSRNIEAAGDLAVYWYTLR